MGRAHRRTTRRILIQMVPTISAFVALAIVLTGALLWTLVGIVRRTDTPVLKLVGLGVAATYGLQACINLVVVTGLGPTKGIALPLISNGGTGWILTSLMLGFVVAMDRGTAEGEPAEMTAARPRPLKTDEPEFDDIEPEADTADEPLEAERDEDPPAPEIVVPGRVKPRVRITPVPASYNTAP